ncbi:hypothetical protein, unlikely [Trypanosoma brucei gambiense DAL972]|uniref:Uncharacterized protein n=1 Tax=Trypanosoma brucei gambiense (strain MHOM/CI/86/DAL972) TaxID=679716 RepID=C9ZV77_TRYB9|nr:hypothetical protein, unlikely [Trypanosoma brucei gambiense DAL972]CBH13315.1 hypothetical protein, unlikely [Trypanosoma brucei gambiense DAL972]|eukprot:XP_011775592.1 hypothetical protein, unlikely [Trypanosoma brucei gambiense DAL972]
MQAQNEKKRWFNSPKENRRHHPYFPAKPAKLFPPWFSGRGYGLKTLDKHNGIPTAHLKGSPLPVKCTSQKRRGSVKSKHTTCTHTKVRYVNFYWPRPHIVTRSRDY